MNNFDKELIGKTIERITEGYEIIGGVRIWTTRFYFTDGTSATMGREGDEYQYVTLRMDVK